MGAQRLTSDSGDDFEDENDILEGQFEDVSGLQDDLDGQLHAIFADVGGEPDDTHYEIRVYRPQKGKGALGYLFACLPAELPIMDKLRDEYGGGTFEVRVLKDKRIFRRKTVIVEPPLKKPATPLIDNSANMADVMAQGFIRLGELIVQGNATQAPQAAPTMAEMLQQMVLMKEVIGGQAPAINPLKQLKDLAEIQNLMGGNSGGDKSETNVNDVLLSLAETVLPKLAEAGAIQQSAVTGSGVGTGEVVPKGSSELRSVQSVPQTRLQNPAEKITQPKEKQNPMKMHLIFLCAQAKMNRNPAVYANMVLDNTPDNKLGELVEFMGSPEAIEKMAETHKAVANYREWFERLSAEIMSQLDIDDPSEEKPELTSEGKPAINGDIEPNKKDHIDAVRQSVTITDQNNGDVIEHT